MVAFIHIASVLSVLLLSVFKRISDKDIHHNIGCLRNKVWFQMYWNDEAYRHIIETDAQLRGVIGYVNPEKLKKVRYEAWQRKKIVTLLEKKVKE